MEASQLEVLHLDFETYCEINLKVVGVHKYTRHKSFDIICFSYALGAEEPKLWISGEPIPKDFIQYVQDPSVTIAAWNAAFEKCVIDRSYKQLGLKKRPPYSKYTDVMALATRLNYPRALDMAGSATGVVETKDPRGNHLINKLCKPKKWSQSTPFTRWTPELARGEFQEFYDYCKQDVRSERAIYRFLQIKKLSIHEKEVWMHTQVQNTRGLKIDLPLTNQIVRVLDEWKADMERKLSKFTKKEITTGGQRARMITFAQNNGVFLPDLTADTVEAGIANTNFPMRVRKLLWYRKKLSKTSTAKFKKMLVAMCSDGTVKSNLIYSPTVTGRFAAAGLQLQNLPARVKFKDVLKENACSTEAESIIRCIEAFEEGLEAVKELTPNVMALASLMVRPCIIPPEGCTLRVSDYSSIENCALHWCAMDTLTCQEFEDGLDQYKTFASDRYKIPYDAVTDTQRFHGKTAVLGLGYQMGDKTYRATAAGYGLELSEQDSKDTVAFYRRKYKEVVRLWYKLYKAARGAVELGGVMEYGNTRFMVQHDRLYMKLPSGRLIAYNQPRVEERKMPWGEMKSVITFMGINPYTNKWARLAISPGRLVENQVQGLTRDILVQGLLNVERAGYKVIGSIHDEGIAYAPEDFGSIEEFDQLMCEMPPWADGLPLKAKGYEAMRYRKE